jgi:hypothetical protein
MVLFQLFGNVYLSKEKVMPIDVSKLATDYGPILWEYCQLASYKQLSKQDTDRLAEILAIAEGDKELSFMLNEVDHFLAHELGLLNEASRSLYKDQQAKLREYFGSKQKNICKPAQTPQEQDHWNNRKQNRWQLGHCP